MLGLIRDLRLTTRQLTKAPVFTLVAVLTVALGIGANTAIFSVLNSVLLHFPPVPNPQQLVYFHLQHQPIHTSSTGYYDMSMPVSVFESMRTRRDVFQDVVGFVPLSFDKVAVRVGSAPEEAQGEMVSGNLFSTLQVQPFMGRGFIPEDESRHSPVAVLSYPWWKSRFAGDEDILGKTFYVKGVPVTIIGVAPAGFRGIDPDRSQMDFWIPLQTRPELNAWGVAPSDGTLYGSRDWLALIMLGRLQPGVTIEQAQAQLAPGFQAAFAVISPPEVGEQKPQPVLSQVRGRESLRHTYEYPLRVLMSMVALVLLIACANVTMLILARNSTRLSEFGMRQALGATRGTLFLQFLQENFVLVLTGAVLGWFFAVWATQALATWSGVQLFIEPDRRVLLFTSAISLLVTLAFALAPLPLVTRIPLNLALRSSSASGSPSRNDLWGRKFVIALQISLCAVLLCAAGLLYHTMRNLESNDLGMRTSGLLVFGITPQYAVRTDAEAVRFHTSLLERMRALPGVDSATLMQIRLGTGGSDNNAVLVDGRNPLPEHRFAALRSDCVGPNFLSTMGIPLHLGRDIATSDTADSPKVAIVNQTFADRYLPGASPLGHQISVFGDTAKFTIVGVAGNNRYTSITEEDRAMAYVPFTQVTGILSMQYELHTSADPKMLIPQAAAVLREVDPDLLLQKPITQQDQFAETVSQERLVANLSVCFGALAAFLVAIGLYATISYAVGRRTMEIGVRMALGAERREILMMILRESLIVGALGLAIGIPASLAVARTLRSMLYGLSPTDPLTIVAALLLITAVTLTAAFLPAYRAATIDPNRALRMD